LPWINDYCRASSLILFDFVALAKNFSQIIAGSATTPRCPHQNPNFDAQLNDNGLNLQKFGPNSGLLNTSIKDACA